MNVNNQCDAVCCIFLLIYSHSPEGDTIVLLQNDRQKQGCFKRNFMVYAYCSLRIGTEAEEDHPNGLRLGRGRPTEPTDHQH